MSLNRGSFFQTTNDFFAFYPYSSFQSLLFTFSLVTVRFFTPLISEHKLYKIGVFNLCCDSNKITVFKCCVVLVEARRADRILLCRVHTTPHYPTLPHTTPEGFTGLPSTLIRHKKNRTFRKRSSKQKKLAYQLVARIGNQSSSRFNFCTWA